MISSLLKEYMNNKHWNIVKLSTMSGINITLLQSWLDNKTIPCYRNFKILADILNISKVDRLKCVRYYKTIRDAGGM